jgi:hypothetical protein
MTKLQLTKAILALGTDKSQNVLMKMHKADLEKMHNDMLELQYTETDYAEECADMLNNTPIDTMSAEDRKAVNTVKAFDLSKYANFNPNNIKPHLRSLATTDTQHNLIKALENNFIVKINVGCDRYETSVKIARVYKAIADGIVQRRTDEEILARIKSYKPQVSNLATKAQLDLITELEKTTGVMNTTVVRDKQTATKIISTYQDMLKQKQVAATEVKPADVPQTMAEKLNDKNFRTKFIERLKRVFA